MEPIHLDTLCEYFNPVIATNAMIALSKALVMAWKGKIERAISQAGPAHQGQDEEGSVDLVEMIDCLPKESGQRIASGTWYETTTSVKYTLFIR